MVRSEREHQFLVRRAQLCGQGARNAATDGDGRDVCREQPAKRKKRNEEECAIYSFCSSVRASVFARERLWQNCACENRGANRRAKGITSTFFFISLFPFRGLV